LMRVENQYISADFGFQVYYLSTRLCRRSDSLATYSNPRENLATRTK